MNRLYPMIVGLVGAAMIAIGVFLNWMEVALVFSDGSKFVLEYTGLEMYTEFEGGGGPVQGVRSSAVHTDLCICRTAVDSRMEGIRCGIIENNALRSMRILRRVASHRDDLCGSCDHGCRSTGRNRDRRDSRLGEMHRRWGCDACQHIVGQRHSRIDRRRTRGFGWSHIESSCEHGIALISDRKSGTAHHGILHGMDVVSDMGRSRPIPPSFERIIIFREGRPTSW